MSVMAPRPTSVMKRTTVMLPSDLRRRAHAAARKRKVSLGTLVRESLDAALPSWEAAREDDPLLSDSAVYEGRAPRDLAKAHDRYLYDDEA
jgi:hypothetical protein